MNAGDFIKVERIYTEKDPSVLAIDQMIAIYFKNISRLLQSKVMRVDQKFQPISQVTKQLDIWLAKKYVVFDALKRIADLLKDYLMQGRSEDQ